MDLFRSARASAVLEHFEVGRSVCPFAPRAAAAADLVELADLERHEPVCQLLARFRPEQEAAIILAPSDPSNHGEAEDAAEQLFGLLTFGLLVPTLQDPERAKPRVLAAARAALHHPTRHPHLVGALPIFVTAMGPAYRADHPRYAPHLIVVMVWAHDVARMQLTQRRSVWLIHNRMKATTGAVYDADTFYLPEKRT